jgi:hypothetical protein
MQGKCNLDLSFCLAEDAFSPDELVYNLVRMLHE